MTNATDRRNGLLGELGIKKPVRVATTANITLSGLQTIDGVTVVEDDRVLVKKPNYRFRKMESMMPQVAHGLAL